MSTCSRVIRCRSRSNGPSKTGVVTSYGTGRIYRPGVMGPAITISPMTRVLSGIQPTGDIHLGNYVGALRWWVIDQYHHESYHLVVDLHALTIPRDPAELRAATLRTA